jgi:hypothetical protein
MTESLYLTGGQRAQWTRLVMSEGILWEPIAARVATGIQGLGIPVNPYGERDPYPWGDASSNSVDLTKGEGF